MSLTTKQVQQLHICVEKYHGNKEQNSKIHSSGMIQQAAFLKSTLWDIGDTITIAFLPLPIPQLMPQWYTWDQVYEGMRPGEKLDPLETKVRRMDPVEAIKLIVNERLQPLVNLKLKFIDDIYNADVRIKLDNTGGSYSQVGTTCRTVQPPEETLNFGWLDVGTILHEFGHVMGMIHEHQNPFGVQIPWNLKVLYKWGEDEQEWTPTETYDNIVKKYNKNIINGSNFDPYSIMLYFFSPELTLNNKGTYANHVLSPTDILWLKSMYPMSGPRILPGKNYISVKSGTDIPKATTPVIKVDTEALSQDIEALEVQFLYRTQNLKQFFNKYENDILFILILLVIFFVI